MCGEEINYEVWDKMIEAWQAKPGHMPRLHIFMSTMIVSINWHVKVANHIRNKGFKVTLDKKYYPTARLIIIEEK